MSKARTLFIPTSGDSGNRFTVWKTHGTDQVKLPADFDDVISWCHQNNWGLRSISPIDLHSFQMEFESLDSPQPPDWTIMFQYGDYSMVLYPDGNVVSNTTTECLKSLCNCTSQSIQPIGTCGGQLILWRLRK